MTELTREDKFYTTRKREIYLRWFLVIVAAVFLFREIKGCKDSNDAGIAYKNIEGKLKSVTDDTARIKGENRRLLYEAADMDLHVADLVADLTTTKGALIEESDRANSLAVAYKKAKSNKDTVGMLANCDSLAEENRHKDVFLKAVFDGAKKLDSTRKAQIKNLEEQRNLFKKGYDSCKNAVVFTVAELPQLKPKGKWYIDITGLTGPITAIGGGAGYMDSNGRIISGDILISGQGSIYQLRLSAPLNLKRKR